MTKQEAAELVICLLRVACLFLVLAILIKELTMSWPQ